MILILLLYCCCTVALVITLFSRPGFSSALSRKEQPRGIRRLFCYVTCRSVLLALNGSTPTAVARPVRDNGMWRTSSALRRGVAALLRRSLSPSLPIERVSACTMKSSRQHNRTYYHIILLLDTITTTILFPPRREEELQYSAVVVTHFIASCPRSPAEGAFLSFGRTPAFTRCVFVELTRCWGAYLGHPPQLGKRVESQHKHAPIAPTGWRPMRQHTLLLLLVAKVPRSEIDAPLARPATKHTLALHIERGREGPQRRSWGHAAKGPMTSQSRACWTAAGSSEVRAGFSFQPTDARACFCCVFCFVGTTTVLPQVESSSITTRNGAIQREMQDAYRKLICANVERKVGPPAQCPRGNGHNKNGVSLSPARSQSVL